MVGKGGKKSTKTEYGVRNCLDREAFIKRFGEKRFNKLCETDSHYKKYALPVFPAGSRWLWNHFMYIWRNCEHDFNGNTVFTFGTVRDYEACMGVSFSIAERRTLFQMKAWAMETICEMEK